MDELPRVSPIGQDHHQQHIQPSSAPRPQVAKLQEEVGDLEEHVQSLISEMHIGALVAISMTDSCKLVRADGGEMAEGRSSRFNKYLVIKLKNLPFV